MLHASFNKKRRARSLSPDPIQSPSSRRRDHDGIADALRSLQVSLKREPLPPPTPVASPVHKPSPKRARPSPESVEHPSNQTQSPRPSSRTALVAVSNRIKDEVDKRMQKRRKQQSHARRREKLNYFAIVGAFHRAAFERQHSSAPFNSFECAVETSAE